jgi:hypothetical protein
MKRNNLARLAVTVFTSAFALAQTPLGTAITYQGRLNFNGAAFDERADFRFTLFDSEANGAAIGNVDLPAVDVVDGLFTVDLDFGPVFHGDAHWLEIQVRPAGIGGPYSTLTPRTRLRPAPNALNADRIDGLDSSAFLQTVPVPLLLAAASAGGNTLRAENTSNAGNSTGVFGFASAASGATRGVYGQTNSPAGVGVMGLHDATSGTTPGVHGASDSASSGAIGLLGEITSTSPGSFSAAVRGQNRGTGGFGIGVWGSHDGTGWGVYGSSPSGTGVYGHASGSTGTNYGVYGQSDSASGYAGYFLGRGYFSLNLGIGTNAPATPLHLAGPGIAPEFRITGAGFMNDNEAWAIQSVYQSSTLVGRTYWRGDSGGAPDFTVDTRLVVGALSVDGNSGFTGLGTNAPGYRLDAAGRVRSRGAGGAAGGMWFTRSAAPAVDSSYIGRGSDSEAWTGFYTPASGWTLAVRDDGRVGIGTTTPDATARLDVRGEIQMRSSAGALRCAMGEFDTGAGGIQTSGPAGGLLVSLGHVNNLPDHGQLTVSNSFLADAGIYVDANGDGIVWGDVKNFRKPNPRRPGTDIVYACIEGPEAAAYIRGTARLTAGRAEIHLPDHFIDVAAETGITVQLTPLSAESRGLAVIEKSRERIVVSELMHGAGDYEFDYFVAAVRAGHENYQIIRDSAEVQPAALSAGGN